MLRILSVAAVAAFLAAGCGSSAGLDRSAPRGLPPRLAHVWAAQATAIAAASAAGDSCGADRLASQLRDDVIAAESRVPVRLQVPLVAGVNALADRTTCPPPPAPPKKHPPKPPKDHGPPHHHHGGGGDQGSQS